MISGVFSLDGQDFDVDNNVWLVGDDDEVLVIDAPHRPEPIVEAVGGRRVAGIVLTHGHNDHITAAVALREAVDAPIWFPAADRMLWDMVYGAARPAADPDRDLTEGTTFRIAGSTLLALHTPGHSPGSTCLHSAGPEHGVHRRHAVLRRPGRDRPVVQRQADDHRARSGPSCSRCTATPWCGPATGTTRRSPRSCARSTDGGHGGARRGGNVMRS